MSDTPALVFTMMALILPVTALVARRAPIATVMKMGAIWVAIFGLGALIITYVIQPNLT